MAREKAEKAVFTFHTTVMAMKMEWNVKESGSPGRLISVPWQISAGCGIVWSAPAGGKETPETLTREARTETKGIYNLFLQNYLRWNVKAEGKDGREL